MSSPRPWIVERHGPIVRLEENLWTVDGGIHLSAGAIYPRKMTLIRLADGRVVIHGGIPLDDASMAEIERWGAPAFYIVPNLFHRLDVHAFHRRYPSMPVLCPPASRRRVEAIVPVAGGYEMLPDELPSRPLPMRTGECVFQVRSGTRVSLVFGDALMNVPHLPGWFGGAMRLSGFTGRAKVTPVTKLALVTDRKQMQRIYRDLAETRGLTRLIPVHGNTIEGDAAAALREVADRI